MRSFRQSVFSILEEGQQLQPAEKSLASKIVDEFVSDYREATHEEPLPLFGTIILVANRLQALGFKMPTLDRWFEEDMFTMNMYGERQGARHILREREGW